MATDLEIRQLVSGFPALYRKARGDWAVFRVADAEGAYGPSDRDRILEWFAGFGRLWDGVRPNWLFSADDNLPGGSEWHPPMSLSFQSRVDFRHEVDAWVGFLDIDRAGLGVAPLVVAGVLVAAAMASAAALAWAIGYVREQGNVSEIINGVAAGVLPAGAIDKIRADAGGLALTLQSATTLLVTGSILYFGWPFLKRWLGRE